MTQSMLSVLLSVLGGIGIGFFIAESWIIPSMRKAAVKAGAGHYAPDTGKFHFGPFKPEKYQPEPPAAK